MVLSNEKQQVCERFDISKLVSLSLFLPSLSFSLPCNIPLVRAIFYVCNGVDPTWKIPSEWSRGWRCKVCVSELESPHEKRIHRFYRSSSIAVTILPPRCSLFDKLLWIYIYCIYKRSKHTYHNTSGPVEVLTISLYYHISHGSRQYKERTGHSHKTHTYTTTKCVAVQVLLLLLRVAIPLKTSQTWV